MNDLGKDPVGKLLVRLAAPAIMAQLVNALYNIVDRIYIGRIPDVGPLALTGVGITFPIIIIITAFSALVGMGGAPLASIKMGKGDKDGAEQILSNSFVMLILLSLLLTIVFFVIKRPTLYAFGASDNTIGYADSYLTIYVMGTLFVQLTVGMNAFITAQGFAKISMATVLIGAVCNITLDPIFIFGLRMGVRGAALATVISQGVSAAWVLVFLFGKRTILHIRREYMRLKRSVVFGTISLGISPFIMQSTESLVTVVLNSTLQRYGGDMAVGSMTIITSIMQFAMMPVQGLVQGAQPIASFNFGAKQFDRVRKSFRLLLISCMTFTILFTLTCELVPKALAFVFTDDAALIDMASGYLRIFAAGTWMMGAQMACQNMFLALGQAKVSLILALLRKVILLIPFVYLFSSFLGTLGVFLAQPIADILAATTTSIVFAVQFKRILRRAAEHG